jgi:transposase-like protein
MEQKVAPTSIDEIAREGARHMLRMALEAEVESYLELHRGERDAEGLALVVRNGRARPRSVTVGSGTIAVQAPRVDDRREVAGARQRFRSVILPPYLRRSREVSELLPLLYLRGLSTGDVRPALAGLLGKNASGLSPTAVTRLTVAWQEQFTAWSRRSLADVDFVYVWADGVYFPVRLEQDRLAALVVVGVRPDGTKELVALQDGHRESKESWLSLLRDLKARGMQAPAVAAGDGALGFWGAVAEVWPSTKEQRCWVHKIANVLDKLPKRLQPEVKKDLHEAMYAESRKACVERIDQLTARLEADHPRAATALQDDLERLLTFFAFPKEHWKHLRTTNPIESTFATVKLRTKATRGAGSRAAGLAMAFQLMQVAQRTWRRIDSPELVPQVRAGVRFRDGVRVERKDHPKPKKSRKVAA